MATLHGFDSTEDYGSVGFAPIPEGYYTASINSTEERETSSRNGSYLRVVFEVIEGEHKGRSIFLNLNLNNPSAVAVRIARAELNAICSACGVLNPKDSSDLHDIPLQIRVKTSPRRDTGEIQNVIRGYKSIGESAQTATTASGAPWKK